jgi:hypothetical protein
MPKRLRNTYTLAASVALMSSVSAQAGANRTFVSTIGNDSNTTANCPVTSPCRTFTAALSVTNPGGEIVVLTSGGYGPATISQPVVITAIGVDASVSGDITINTTGNVTLIGLNLHGEGIYPYGVLVEGGGFVRLYNMLIENFSNVGVEIAISGSLEMSGCSINDIMPSHNGVGLSVEDGASAYVHNCSFTHNSTGAQVFDQSQAIIADSSAAYNVEGFVSLGSSAASSTLTLINDRVVFNGVGLSVEDGALYFANCFIANNGTAYRITPGAGNTTMAGTNPGTSLIAPGQATVGTLGTPIALQ